MPDAPPSPPIGPIPRFRGARDGIALLDVTVCAPEGADPPAVTAERAVAGPEPLGTLAGTAFWSWRLEAPLGRATPYEAEGRRHHLVLPAEGETLRIAYASCNGSEDEERAARLPGGRDAMWRHLAGRHRERPMHLLVMGGDQIYADGLWRLPPLSAWSRLRGRRRDAVPFDPGARAALEAHYLRTYASVFGAPDVAEALATIPSVMMWDDHDIVDGWGSRSEGWQASPVARGIFETAARAFDLIQLGRRPGACPRHWAGMLGPARIVVPDLRTERTRRRVLGAEGHRFLADAIGADAPHLVLVSSVPMVNLDLSTAERVVAPLMPVADLYQDDLRDQWMSHAHAAEWAEVMRRLLAAAAEGARVTVLSGEIHLGAHGSAGEERARVEQLTASGIAHPPPPRALARLYDRLARRPWRREGIALAMNPLGGTDRRYLAERNWLELEAHPDGRAEAVLHGERSGAIRLLG